MNLSRATPRHIIIKPLKVKDEDLKISQRGKKRERDVTHKGIPIRQQQIFQHKLSRPEENGMTYSNTRKKKKKTVTTNVRGWGLPWQSSDYASLLPPQGTQVQS